MTTRASERLRLNEGGREGRRKIEERRREREGGRERERGGGVKEGERANFRPLATCLHHSTARPWPPPA